MKRAKHYLTIISFATFLVTATPQLQLHNTPTCLNAAGGATSRDIAAAITHHGVHHVWQLCGTGWHHSSSSDLVNWFHRGIDLKEWPSGFVVIDPVTDELCAGFRSTTSNTANNNSSSSSKMLSTPLVLRCAKDNPRDLISPFSWSPPEIMLNVSFWRFLPYDPFRPFQDDDGQWYAGIALDACNNTKTQTRTQTRTTTAVPPCPLGGQLNMWTSPYLRGPLANWSPVEAPMLTSNRTVFGANRATESYEFVTVDYIGFPSSSFFSSPASSISSSLRVVLNNPYYARGSTEYFIGVQHNGSTFETRAIGMLDWSEFHLSSSGSGSGSHSTGINALNTSKNNPSGGRLGMTRSLGSTNGNQLTGAGRRIAIGWVSAALHMHTTTPITMNTQSLPRVLVIHVEDNDAIDINIDNSEVNADANSTNTADHVADDDGDVINSPVVQLRQSFIPELQVLRQSACVRLNRSRTFVRDVGKQVEIYALFQGGNRLELDVFAHNRSNGEKTSIVVDKIRRTVCVNGTLQGAHNVRCGPLESGVHGDRGSLKTTSMHVYLDQTLLEVIVNNVTAITASINPTDAAMASGVGVVLDDYVTEVNVEVWPLSSIHVQQ